LRIHVAVKLGVAQLDQEGDIVGVSLKAPFQFVYLQGVIGPGSLLLGRGTLLLGHLLYRRFRAEHLGSEDPYHQSEEKGRNYQNESLTVVHGSTSGKIVLSMTFGV
jgi:hypothetical protein